MEHTYTERQKIGKKLAEILCLKKDKEYKNRYLTTWGNKTDIGIYETVIHILEQGA